MAEWPLAVVRLGLYGGLGLLFGLPAFVLTTPGGERLWGLFRLGFVLAMLAVAGLALSLLGFLLLVARMSGVGLGSIDPAIVQMLVAQSSLGWAFIARMAALIVALGLSLLLRPGRTKRVGIVLCGGVAVATLAWGGHGAGTDGAAGFVHLSADIVHLLAASAWIGALALLLALVSPGRAPTSEQIETAHAALAGFGRTGTAVVAIIVLTGIANGAFILGVEGLPTLAASLYGRLLIAKLILFAAMLGCAALNRYRLTPALQGSIARGELRPGLVALRRSIALETSLALAVLALVGWLGMLEPGATG
jgi:putative copper resistance protein D